MAIRCHHLYMSYVKTVLNDINVNGFGFIVSNVHGMREFRENGVYTLVHFTRSTCNAHNKPKEFGRCVCVLPPNCLLVRSFVRPSISWISSPSLPSPPWLFYLLLCLCETRSLSVTRSLTYFLVRCTNTHSTRARAFLCVCTRRRSPSPTVKSNSGGKHL